MPAPTTCTCSLTVKSFAGTTFTTAELVCEPRKSLIQSATTNLIVGTKQSVTADSSGVCTMTLASTTVDSQKVIFTLNWNNGNNFGSVVFDPITIPSTATVDLSTLLSVSRG